MPDDVAVSLLKRLGTLEQQRITWESHWQDIADFIVPRKANISRKRSAGDKMTEYIFDGTAIHAAEMLSASLHGMLTNMSVKWFSLEYRQTDLNGDDSAREWLQSVEDVMYKTFARSNFQEQIHELYHDLITFGTAVMFIEADPDTDIRFSTRHIGECYLSEDDKGRVDTVYRKFKMPLKAVITRFGEDKLSKKLRDKYRENPFETTEIVHCVYPRDDRDPTKLTSENKPYASVYIEPDEKIILSVSGFDELPYTCPRWLKSSFEIGYGRSPAMTSLSDIKKQNKRSEVTIRAAQKQVDPPLLVPDDGFILPVRTVPGGLNFYRSGTRDRIEPLQIGANNPLGLNMEEQRRQAIRSAFYVDQLILAQGPQMTATEVVQRTEEKMRLLGPVLGRLQAEMLQPLIARTFNILARAGRFPVAPEFMMDMDLQIEYVSPLAKAQKQGDITSINQLLELLGPLGQLDPKIMDYVDFDGVAKHLIKTLSIPATTISSDQEVSMKRQDRQQQMEEAQEQQQMMETAEAGGKVAPLLAAAQNQQ